jgi:L-2-hydroxyglutarate oxidase
MMPATHDVVVAGGGLVGLATALALSDGGRRSLVLLEAEERLAAHQSSHNSGVIHSGLYYAPETLKAQTCREGRDAMFRFCAAEGIPHRRDGKLVVATRPAELAPLAQLEARGRANGLTGVKQLGRDELRALEPEVSGLAGLWVPETGVVDFALVAAALARRVRSAGVEIRTGTRVLGARDDGSAAVVITNRGELRASLLVACAGLHADRVARACGVDPELMIIPFRGEYYELLPERRELVRHPIYPVPDPRLPFLGVHFTRSIDGHVHAGPNAVLALKREGYARTDVSARDVAEMLGFVGFWRMAGRYWPTGLAELARSLSKAAFVRALQRLVPNLRAEDVVPGGSGVRAQAVDRAGRLIGDFKIVEGKRSLHVLNAPSPAATACLSIGRHIAGRARALLER